MASSRFDQYYLECFDLISELEGVPQLTEEEWLELIEKKFIEKKDHKQFGFIDFIELFVQKMDRVYSDVVRQLDLPTSEELNYDIHDFLFELIPKDERLLNVSNSLECFTNALIDFYQKKLQDLQNPKKTKLLKELSCKAKLLTDFTSILKAKAKISEKTISTSLPVRLITLYLTLPDMQPDDDLIGYHKEAYLQNLLLLIAQLIDIPWQKKAKEKAKLLTIQFELDLRSLGEWKEDQLNYFIAMKGIDDAQEIYKEFYLEPKIEKQARTKNKNFEHVVGGLSAELSSDKQVQGLYAKYKQAETLQQAVRVHQLDCKSEKSIEKIKGEMQTTFQSYTEKFEPALTHSRDRLLNKVIKTFFGVIFTGVLFYPLLHHKIWGANSEKVANNTKYNFFKVLQPNNIVAPTKSDWPERPRAI